MSKNPIRDGLKPFLPEKSLDIIVEWIYELNLKVVLWNHRETKLGDFRAPLKPWENASISINKSLNPYSFLITIVHELAHAAIYQTYGRTVKPHGYEWKNEYKNRMLIFLNNRVFPPDIEREVAYHLINPKASSTADVHLTKVLRKYDLNYDKSMLYVDDLQEGDRFMLSNGMIFIKGKKQRTRHQCIEEVTQRKFLVAGIAEIKKLD